MEIIVITFIVTILLLILIVCLGIIIFTKDSSIFNKGLSVFLIIFSTFCIIFTLQKSNEEIEIQGIEKYLNSEIIRTIDHINYTKENIPKDTVYTYIKVNE